MNIKLFEINTLHFPKIQNVSLTKRMTEALTVRVVLIGDSQVGKTSLIHRFVRSSFEKQQKGTIGAVFHTYEQQLNGRQVVMQIWDTAGQEKYRSLGPIYYRNAAAGIAVFDVTSKESLPSLERWISEFKKHTDNPLLFIVGNKIDIDDSIVIKLEEAQEFATNHGAKCFLTSAKTGENVKEMFQSVFDDLVKAGKIVSDKPLKPEEADGASNGSCC
ncbi:small GTP-binding protein [Tritrichomonas foetus]|uniref:Small GTP-binding protein n=1 Tax=Tritrichomonas foetus TaxID=1144522 RepID=A0A1J4JPR7_9EUKA|nr:small GTP-binding protein [Tritrichomonas foetus]|eukprot:OHT01143.1 small GTP-binding protein [Tritrichomonas foetus]